MFMVELYMIYLITYRKEVCFFLLLSKLDEKSDSDYFYSRFNRLYILDENFATKVHKIHEFSIFGLSLPKSKNVNYL